MLNLGKKKSGYIWVQIHLKLMVKQFMILIFYWYLSFTYLSIYRSIYLSICIYVDIFLFLSISISVRWMVFWLRRKLFFIKMNWYECTSWWYYTCAYTYILTHTYVYIRKLHITIFIIGNGCNDLSSNLVRAVCIPLCANALGKVVNLSLPRYG